MDSNNQEKANSFLPSENVLQISQNSKQDTSSPLSPLEENQQTHQYLNTCPNELETSTPFRRTPRSPNPIRNYNYTPSTLKTPEQLVDKLGVKAEDEFLFRKYMQEKYRNELNSLIKLHKESETLNNNLSKSFANQQFTKIQKMNDKYNLEQVSNQNILKEYLDYNAKEAEKHRQQKEQERRKEYEEYLIKINNIQAENEINKKLNLEKKNYLREQVQNDLNLFRQKRFDEKQKEIDENRLLILNSKSDNNLLFDSEKDYPERIKKMNSNIYNHASKYNYYFNGDKNNDLFKSNNDLIYNKKVAEMKLKQKKEEQDQIMENGILQRQKEQQQKMFEKELKARRLNEQLNYKEFLDRQADKKRERVNKENILLHSGQELLMPSYRYSNVPKPLINYTLHKNISNNREMFSYIESGNKEKETGAGISLNNKGRGGRSINYYLGDSSLEHNPITCPIGDPINKRFLMNQVYGYNPLRSKSIDKGPFIDRNIIGRNNNSINDNLRYSKDNNNNQVEDNCNNIVENINSENKENTNEEIAVNDDINNKANENVEKSD